MIRTNHMTMAFSSLKTLSTSLPFILIPFFLLLTIHCIGSTGETADSKSYDRIHGFGGGQDEWGMVQRKGNQFMAGGEPFYVNGFNTYWLMTLAVDQSTKGKVSEVLQQAASVGLTVCRTWGFSDGGWRALQKSPSVYDEEVFKALDFVVSEARKYKIRLIFPLINNWPGYGGKQQYVKWAAAAGVNLTSDDDFFSDPTIKDYYKANAKVVLNRVNTITNITYKDDPTIFSWELMNEPQCPSDPSGNKLQAWLQEMAFYVKSIDHRHLLGTGTEGFYGSSTPDRMQFNPNAYSGQVGADFVRNHQVMGIDYASAHIYPDSWLSTSVLDDKLRFVKTWMQNHIDDAENALSMPVIFSEFGTLSTNNKMDSTFRDSLIKAVYDTLLNSTKRGGSAGGCLLWQLFPEGTDYMDDGYAVVLTRSASTAGILALQSKRLQMFNSKCSWNCRWSCKKKSPKDLMLGHHDEL